MISIKQEFHDIRPSIFIIIAATVSMISSLGAPLVPNLAEYFNINISLAQWSLTVTLISATISTPILSKVSSIGKFRSTIIAALVMTLIGCLISTYSKFFYIFLIGRALQGIGMGIVPTLMSGAKELLIDSEHTVSLLSITTAIGIGVGYPISGIIATNIGVLNTFIFGVLMVVVALIAAFKLKNPHKNNVETFDFQGSILLAVIVVSFLLLLGTLETAFNFTYFITLLVLLIFSIRIWIHTNKKQKFPLIKLKTLIMGPNIIANSLVVIIGSIMYMLISSSMYRIQQQSYPGLNLTSTMAGLSLVPLSVATLFSRYTKLHILTLNSKLILGCIFLIFSLIVFGFSKELISIFVSLGLCGYAVGIIYSSVPQIISQNIDINDVHESFSLNQIFRSIGYSIGSVITVNILKALDLNFMNEPSLLSYQFISKIGILLALLAIGIIFCYQRRLRDFNL